MITLGSPSRRSVVGGLLAGCLAFVPFPTRAANSGDAAGTSPITNQTGESKAIATRHFRIYTGTPGFSYNHHHQITSLNGVLIASWSNGYANEDHPGQRMMMATSTDDGETWSDARPVRDRMAGKYADVVITAMGIRPYHNRLIAYYGVYEYPRAGLVPGTNPAMRVEPPPLEPVPPGIKSFGERTEIIVSDDGGRTWSKPVGRIAGFVPNLKPKPLRSGRLVITGMLMFPYTDDPEGIRGWVRTGIPGLPADYRDGPEMFQAEEQRRSADWIYCESSFFQTDDGVVHMLMRSEKTPGYLGVSESHDDGATWSEPVPTRFRCDRNRFDCGRLPDGRYFVVYAPQPGRRPLMLSTGRDGVVFDQHYILADGPRLKPRIKGGNYGYPSYHIMGNRMYVIYSVSKEDIEVCRFDLSELN